MDRVRAKKLAASQRYRLQVRLSLVRRQAARSGRPDLAVRVEALKAKVDAVQIGDDEVETSSAARQLARLTPEVMGLQGDAGVPEHGLSVFPRWLEFTLWTTPFVLLVGTFALIMALRRRKTAVGEASLAALEASADAAERRGGA